MWISTGSITVCGVDLDRLDHRVRCGSRQARSPGAVWISTGSITVCGVDLDRLDHRHPRYPHGEHPGIVQRRAGSLAEQFASRKVPG
jgi:hypothetical protein